MEGRHSIDKAFCHPDPTDVLVPAIVRAVLSIAVVEENRQRAAFPASNNLAYCPSDQPEKEKWWRGLEKLFTGLPMGSPSCAY